MAISTRTRFEVLKRDDFTCRYCGRAAPEVRLHVDHIVPASKGGSDELVNLVTACQDCNLGKAAVPLQTRAARSDTTQLVAEMRAVKTYLAEREDFLEWREEAMREVYRYWTKCWNTPVPQGPWPNTVRKWLEHYPPAEINQAIDLAIEKISGGTSKANPTDVVRYLCGIMKHKIAGTFDKPRDEPAHQPQDATFAKLWEVVVPITVDKYDGCPEAAWPEIKRHVYDQLGVEADAFVPLYFSVFDDCACERCYGPLLEEIAA